jgi:hypothetical protein
VDRNGLQHLIELGIVAKLSPLGVIPVLLATTRITTARLQVPPGV